MLIDLHFFLYRVSIHFFLVFRLIPQYHIVYFVADTVHDIVHDITLFLFKKLLVLRNTAEFDVLLDYIAIWLNLFY